jgi:hypothetical protein
MLDEEVPFTLKVPQFRARIANRKPTENQREDILVEAERKQEGLSVINNQ